MTKGYTSKIENIFRKLEIKGFLKWLIEEGITLNDEIYNRPFYKVGYCAILGETEHALELLAECVKMRSLRISLSIKIDPIYDQLRNDPRFIRLLEKMNLN